MIIANDEHSLKALFPIEIAEEGIVICAKDGNHLKANLSIIMMKAFRRLNLILSL